MSIEALNCQCCGAPLKIAGSVCECEYCSSINIIGGDAGKYISQLNRANKLRQKCEFDSAYTIYDTILSENTPSVDVLWSQALCEYGIEYVPDPISSRYFPTLHRIKDLNFLDSRCYTEALELANDEQKEQLEKSAEEIARIQENYLNIAANEKPYDAFICYKETDANSGEITEDVKLAEELYNELTRSGFKVFFARETLKNKLSVDYEPYIFAALKSARAMAVIGTKAEYFTSVWVKNEWGRFLKLMDEDPSKNMFFACDAPEELPRAFATKQAQILGKENAIQNLAANMITFLKGGATETYSDSEYMTDQDVFDEAIKKKAKDYIYKIEKTAFKDYERNIMKEAWSIIGYAEVTKNLYSKTFQIGAIIMMITELLYIPYIAMRIEWDESTGLFIFSAILTLGFFASLGVLITPIVFLNFFDFRRPNSEADEIVIPIIGHIGTVVIAAIIAHLFIYAGFPFSGVIMLIAAPLILFLIGFARWLNPSFRGNQKTYSAVKEKLKQIYSLEEMAKNEFLEYAKGELDKLKHNGDIGSRAYVKAYHYDEIKPAVRKIIDEDTKSLNRIDSLQLDSSLSKNHRLIFTLVYTFVTFILSAVGLIIIFYYLPDIITNFLYS